MAAVKRTIKQSYWKQKQLQEKLFAEEGKAHEPRNCFTSVVIDSDSRGYIGEKSRIKGKNHQILDCVYDLRMP